MLNERGIFRTKLNICAGTFFTSIKPYFKTYILNSIQLLLGSIFYTTHPFMKKLTTLKTSGEVSYLLIQILWSKHFLKNDGALFNI